MPGFLGGSDLAVPIGANKQLGADWIAAFTSTAAEKALQAVGNIPNTTTLLDTSKVGERAALRSWFVPAAKNWVNVENGNILRTMLCADPDREALGQAGGGNGERQHHVHAQRFVGNA